MVATIPIIDGREINAFLENVDNWGALKSDLQLVDKLKIAVRNGNFYLGDGPPHTRELKNILGL